MHKSPQTFAVKVIEIVSEWTVKDSGNKVIKINNSSHVVKINGAVKIGKLGNRDKQKCIITVEIEPVRITNINEKKLAGKKIKTARPISAAL